MYFLNPYKFNNYKNVKLYQNNWLEFVKSQIPIKFVQIDNFEKFKQFWENVKYGKWGAYFFGNPEGDKISWCPDCVREDENMKSMMKEEGLERFMVKVLVAK